MHHHENKPIVAANLSKTYRVLEGKKGLRGALKNLVSRDYTHVHALKDATFDIEQSSIVGLIGPNGAGKSTTIKILAGILTPSSGEARVLGRDPAANRKENALNIAVVFGQRTKLWWDLPCFESYELHCRMYRIPPAIYAQRIEEFSRVLEIDKFWHTPVRQLSLGQRMRAELAVSLLHDPRIVYLDEPTIGLDAVGKERIRQFIHDRNEKYGTTFLITSHDMVDISRLCSRIMIIDKGILIYDGSIPDISTKYGGQRVLKVELREDYEDFSTRFGSVVSDEGLIKSISFNRAECSAVDLIKEIGGRYEIADVSIEETEIEEIVRGIYEHGVDEHAK
jgi:ABC-2 type transport system ATP-binding protein